MATGEQRAIFTAVTLLGGHEADRAVSMLGVVPGRDL
jgi:hypothetical protein